MDDVLWIEKADGLMHAAVEVRRGLRKRTFFLSGPMVTITRSRTGDERDEITFRHTEEDGWLRDSYEVDDDGGLSPALCLVHPVDLARELRLFPSWFGLRLMPSVGHVSDIPSVGKTLVIVADVGGVLHFRIFDGDGRTVVDTDETRLTAQSGQIADLKTQLKDLWSSLLVGGPEQRVVTAVTSIVGYTLPSKVPPTLEAEHLEIANDDARYRAWKDSPACKTWYESLGTKEATGEGTAAAKVGEPGEPSALPAAEGRESDELERVSRELRSECADRLPPQPADETAEEKKLVTDLRNRFPGAIDESGKIVDLAAIGRNSRTKVYDLLVNIYIKQNPDADSPKIALATGVPEPMVRKSGPWKSKKYRERGGEPPPSSVYARGTSVQQHEDILSNTADDGRASSTPNPLDELIELDEAGLTADELAAARREGLQKPEPTNDDQAGAQRKGQQKQEVSVDDLAAAQRKAQQGEEEAYRRWEASGSPRYGPLRDRVQRDRNKPS
jgi:hypothetical protein